MRRTARDDLDHAFVLQLFERVDEISLVAVVPEIERRDQILDVHLCDVVKLGRLAACAKFLFDRQLDQIFEVMRVTLL